MRLQTKEFKEACRVILQAIDTKETSLFNETLELKSEGTILTLSVTNREYFCKVAFNLGYEDNNHFSVNATKFLKLMDKITSEEIEITVKDTHINIKANGEYKLPIVYNNDVMVELPPINVNNPVTTMDISKDILTSIMLNNSKELQRGKPSREVSKYYYFDEKGCITFVSGACVNSFELPEAVKVLLPDKVVKMFKLFKEDQSVSFKTSVDQLPNGVSQTIVGFFGSKVSITAKVPFGIIDEVPVESIRALASKDFPYKVTLNKSHLTEVLSRLIIFTDDKNYGYFDFSKDKVVISDFSRENSESITLDEECSALESYTMILNLDNFTKVLDGCENTLTLCFGDSRSVLVKKNNISDLLPELRVVN